MGRARLIVEAKQLFEPVHRIVGARTAATAAGLLGPKLIEASWQRQAARTATLDRLATAREIGPDDPLGYRQLQRVDATTPQIITKQLQGAVGTGQPGRLVVIPPDPDADQLSDHGADPGGSADDAV